MVYMVLTLKYSIQCWDIERPACAIQHETEVCQNHEGRTLQTYDKNELNHIKAPNRFNGVCTDGQHEVDSGIALVEGEAHLQLRVLIHAGARRTKEAHV